MKNWILFSWFLSLLPDVFAFSTLFLVLSVFLYFLRNIRFFWSFGLPDVDHIQKSFFNQTCSSDFRNYINRNVTFYTIWYHLHNLKNVQNIHGGVILLVKLQAEACKFTKSITPSQGFFTFSILYKLQQIAQGISYFATFLLQSDKRWKP